MSSQIGALASTARLGKVSTAEQAPLAGIYPYEDCSTVCCDVSSSPDPRNLKFEFLVDKVSWKGRAKPSKSDIACIRKRLELPEAHVSVDIETLENFIRNGFTIMPGICQGGTKKEDWVGQQLFFLDFDNNEALRKRGYETLDPQDALNRAFEEGLDPLFLYFTHSSSIDPYRPRYRLVFGFDELRTNKVEAERTGHLLLSVFHEADPSSCQLNRMFFCPGKEVLPCWRMIN